MILSWSCIILNVSIVYLSCNKNILLKILVLNKYWIQEPFLVTVQFFEIRKINLSSQNNENIYEYNISIALDNALCICRIIYSK